MRNWWKWEKCGRWRASYTVEAALVFPVLFSILVFLLFITFYAHDVVVQKAVCYETALEAVHGGGIEDTGKIRCIRPSEEELFEYARGRILAGIIDGRERNISINLGEKEKQVCIEEREYSEAVCEGLDTAAFIRNVHRVRMMAEKVKEELTPVGKGDGKGNDK